MWSIPAIDGLTFTNICTLVKPEMILQELMKIAASELKYENGKDLNRARAVRKVLRSTGFKSYKSIYHMINKVYIENLPVDPKVFRVADALFGTRTNSKCANEEKEKRTNSTVP